MEGLHPVDLLIHGLNIIVLFILLRLILWKPIIKFLTARARRVEDELAAAEASQTEAAAMKSEYEQNLESIDAQSREILRDSQIRASEQSMELLRLAKEQSDAMLTDAHDKIEAEKTQAVISARGEIAQLAADMAARILKREVKPEDNLSAARDFFDEAR
jgi:F-type H+-transporting ATPase subunit b